MKNLILITRADTQQSLADTLRGLQQVSGFTFTPVEGHGAQAAQDNSISARDRVVGYTPQVRVDILLEAADIKPVLAALGRPDVGLKGRCIYWVTAAEQYGQL